MNMQEMMRQAKVMQDRMQRLQEELSELEVSGESGGGLVKVVMTCKGEVRSLDVSYDVIDPGNKETMEDLIVAALNNARGSADQAMADETKKMMQELGLPTDVKLPDF